MTIREAEKLVRNESFNQCVVRGFKFNGKYYFEIAKSKDSFLTCKGYTCLAEVSQTGNVTFTNAFQMTVSNSIKGISDRDFTMAWSKAEPIDVSKEELDLYTLARKQR